MDWIVAPNNPPTIHFLLDTPFGKFDEALFRLKDSAGKERAIIQSDRTAVSRAVKSVVERLDVVSNFLHPIHDPLPSRSILRLTACVATDCLSPILSQGTAIRQR
jgi:hypothetical protein